MLGLLRQYYETRNAGAWSQKAKAGNLKKFTSAYYFLEENQIFTIEELERRSRELSASANTLLEKSKAINARINQLDNIITFAEHIHRIQSVIDEMNAIHWKGRREKFRAAHQDEIDLYYTSQRILKEKHGVKKIDIPAWKKEQAGLYQQTENINSQYKLLWKKLNQMLSVKYCVDVAKQADEPKLREKRIQPER